MEADDVTADAASTDTTISTSGEVVKIRMKKAGVVGIAATALLGASGWVYTGQQSIESRVTRLEERQSSTDREVDYARRDIRELMFHQGISAQTPPPREQK